ncbi:hypothetical protein MUP50_00975, partial [Patescibacteria group bacterium]|nr:hypothetical protein [Patescibacteria group bacterium]
MKKVKPKKRFNFKSIPLKIKTFIKKYPLWVCGGILALVIFIWLFKDLPSPTRLGSFPFPASTSIYDRNGQLLYEIFTEKNRTPIKIKDLP